MPVPSTPPPDYGIDAPGVRRGMLLACLVGVSLLGVAAGVATRVDGIAATAAGWAAVAAAVVAVYGSAMAA